jgi:hypothetical protein
MRKLRPDDQHLVDISSDDYNGRIVDIDTPKKKVEYIQDTCGLKNVTLFEVLGMDEATLLDVYMGETPPQEDLDRLNQNFACIQALENLYPDYGVLSEVLRTPRKGFRKDPDDPNSKDRSPFECMIAGDAPQLLLEITLDKEGYR